MRSRASSTLIMRGVSGLGVGGSSRTSLSGPAAQCLSRRSTDCGCPELPMQLGGAGLGQTSVEFVSVGDGVDPKHMRNRLACNSPRVGADFTNYCRYPVIPG